MTQKTWPEVVGSCLGVLAIPLTEAWFLMLVMGAVHSVDARVPAIGYGTSFLFMIGHNMVAGYVRRLRRK